MTVTQSITSKSYDETTTSGMKVDHTYRDYSHVTAGTPIEEIKYEDNTAGATMPGGTRGTDSNFPAKLHHILSQPGLAHIITWLPHGRSWRLVDRQAFLSQIMPNYFSHSNYASFARQVNGWGFKRLSRKGTDYGSYYHELFLRGMPHVAKRMRRPLKIGRKAAPDPENEPNLEAISRRNPLPELSLSKGYCSGFSLTSKKGSHTSKMNPDSQMENLFNNPGFFKKTCNSSNAFSQEHNKNTSLHRTDFLSEASKFNPTPGVFSQDSILQSLYQGLQPQDNTSTVQAFLNQYTRANLPQDNSNDIIMSNMLQYNIGRNCFNNVGPQNSVPLGTQDQNLQLALLQQHMHQSQANVSLRHRFALQTAEAQNDPRGSQNFKIPTNLGYGSQKLDRMNESLKSDLISSGNEGITSSMSCFKPHGDDERSISSDIF